MNLTRRRFLAGLLPAAALVVAACDQPRLVRISTTQTSSSGSVSGVAAGALAPPAPPPTLLLPEASVAQGGTFVAEVIGDGIVAAVVEFAGRRAPAVPAGDRWLAIVPTGQPVGSAEQLAPGSYPLLVRYDVQAPGNPGVLEGAVTVTPAEFPVEAIALPPGVESLLDPALVAQETVILQATYGVATPQRFWDGAFVRPSPAPVTDVYGSRRSYNGGPATGSHSGVDFGAAAGSPVIAAAAGNVVLARAVPVRGNMVIIDHGAGVLTGYCHLSTFSVEPGQPVGAGDLIGAVGTTGLSTGPHLHWELVAGGMHVDGLRWLQI